MSNSKHNPKLERFATVMEENARKWDVARAMGVTEQGFNAAHPELDEMSKQTDKRIISDIKKGAALTGVTGLAAAAVPILLRKKINTPTWVKALITSASGGVGATAAGYASVKTFGYDALEAVADYHAAENTALALEIGKQAPQFTAAHLPVQIVGEGGFTDRTPKRCGCHSEQADADKRNPAQLSKA